MNCKCPSKVKNKECGKAKQMKELVCECVKHSQYEMINDTIYHSKRCWCFPHEKV